MAIVAAETAGRRADRIEALLSARLFVEPQLADDRITFVSNLSGHLSLYAMDVSGGVPEPLLPPQVALQNPELVGGHLFHVAAGLGSIRPVGEPIGELTQRLRVAAHRDDPLAVGEQGGAGRGGGGLNPARGHLNL